MTKLRGNYLNQAKDFQLKLLNGPKNARIWTNRVVNFMMTAKLDYVEERLRDAIS